MEAVQVAMQRMEVLQEYPQTWQLLAHCVLNIRRIHFVQRLILIPYQMPV